MSQTRVVVGGGRDSYPSSTPESHETVDDPGRREKGAPGRPHTCSDRPDDQVRPSIQRTDGVLRNFISDPLTSSRTILLHVEYPGRHSQGRVRSGGRWSGRDPTDNTEGLDPNLDGTHL